MACGGGNDSPDGETTTTPTPTCSTSAQCDDDTYCNGEETCAPTNPNADAFGCVDGDPPCPDSDELCVDGTKSCEDRCELLPDADGDGSLNVACGGDDCDDEDVTRHPGNVEICDLVAHDEDCDPRTFGFRDQDGDDVPDAACCNEDEGELFCGDDCNDSDPGVSPRVPEVCDGVDNDCDDEVDEGVTRSAYQDADGDGYGDPTVPVMAACGDASGVADNGLDCDDTSDEFRPGAQEICDGRDNNCDGVFERDLDNDGHLDPNSLCAIAVNGDLPLDDCNDLSPHIYTGAPERCDGMDNDCDSLTDERSDADLICATRLGVLAGFCLDGACAVTACEPLMGDCNDADADGCETDLSASAGNCGACGRTCPLGETCDNGACALPSFVDLAVGDEHACAVADTGALGCWGKNTSSQLGDRAQQDSKLMVTGFGFDDVVRVATGSGHTCVRHADGAVSCFGANYYGQSAGTSGPVIHPTAKDQGLAGVGELVSRGLSSCALVEGESYCWGQGVTEWTEAMGPQLVSWGQDVLSIDAQTGRQCAVLQDGKAYCVGWDDESLGNEHLEGDDGCDTTDPRGGGGSLVFCETSPVEISGNLSNLEEVSGSCVRSGSKVWCWDDEEDLPLEKFDTFSEGEVLTGLAAYPNQGYCARTASGKAYCDTNHFPSSSPPSVLFDSGVTDVAVGESAFCVLVDGYPRCAGSALASGRGNNPAPQVGVLPVLGAERVTDVFPLSSTSCVRYTTGRVACWGDGVELPTIDPAWQDILSLDSGTGFECGLDGVGDIHCKGNNDVGQLGSPGGEAIRKVSLPDLAIQMDTEDSGTCATLSDGSIYCWGQSRGGRFGSGAPEEGDDILPTRVEGVEHAVQVSLGSDSACAVTALGEVFCWGDGEAGQLGDGLSTSSTTKVKAQLYEDVVQVEVGTQFACALRMGGQVYCWGQGPAIGRGESIASSALPLAVPGVDNVVQLTAGRAFACVLDETHHVTCWGNNETGSVGTGIEPSVLGEFETPHTIGGLQASQVRAHATHVCALTTDGRPMCWGDHSSGQVSGFVGCPEIELSTSTLSITLTVCAAPEEVVGF